MINNLELEYLINQKLNSDNIIDVVPNGLQVEGNKEINNIITGVTASQALINYACQNKADAIIVHHGFFWKNESQLIRGIKYNRLKKLLMNNINLYSWHLPLDIHPELGNNVQFAKTLNIKIIGMINNMVLQGELINPLNGIEFQKLIQKKLGYKVFYFNENIKRKIKYLSWCTGAGQKYIDLLFGKNIDAFISGELSEQTIHSAREIGIHFYAAGHHASERGGIKALTNWLSTNYNLYVKFLDIYNPG